MHKLMSLLFLLFIGTSLIAQTFKLPKDIELETKEDFINSEAIVLEAIDWIHNTPLSENQNKRKDIDRFLLMWMMGSPSVSITLVPDLIPMDCIECLSSFMAGWTKYSLENDNSTDNVLCAMAGVERAIAFYEMNKDTMGKNSDMESLIKQKKKGKLLQLVQSKF